MINLIDPNLAESENLRNQSVFRHSSCSIVKLVLDLVLNIIYHTLCIILNQNKTYTHSNNLFVSSR